MYKKIFTAFYLLMVLCFFVIIIKKNLSNKEIITGMSLDSMEVNLEILLPGKALFKEIYGVSNNLLSPNEIASAGGAIVKDADGYLIDIRYREYDLTQPVTNISKLNEVCHECGTEFVYVSFPSKLNESITSKTYGIETNHEELRNNFIDELESKGIDVLNVRSQFENEGYTAKDIFFKTDHHWKTTSGLYAARAIVQYLNDAYEYNLAIELLDEDRFTYTVYSDMWLGETGRSVSYSWVGELDDFTEIRPNYATSFIIKTYQNPSGSEGDFGLFVDDSGYRKKNDMYDYNPYISYRGADSFTEIHNNNVIGKKILIVKDSFSIAMIPFLSLTTSDIMVWDMRGNENSLFHCIQDNSFDMVILAYTDFWKDNMYSFK